MPSADTDVSLDLPNGLPSDLPKEVILRRLPVSLLLDFLPNETNRRLGVPLEPPTPLLKVRLVWNSLNDR